PAGSAGGDIEPLLFLLVRPHQEPGRSSGRILRNPADGTREPAPGGRTPITTRRPSERVGDDSLDGVRRQDGLPGPGALGTEAVGEGPCLSGQHHRPCPGRGTGAHVLDGLSVLDRPPAGRGLYPYDPQLLAMPEVRRRRVIGMPPLKS